MKLITVLTVLGLCCTIANAAYTLQTYSDNACTTPVGFWQTTDACLDKKRSNMGACFQAPDGSSVWLTVFECSGVDVVPTVAVPEGWISLKYTTNDNCDFASYELTAVPETGSAPVLMFLPGQSFAKVVMTNTTCSPQGVLSASLYNAEIPFDLAGELLYDTCSQFSGRTALQTSCLITTPTEPPMADAPIATPISAPTARSAPTKTPLTKSDAISTAVGSLAVILNLAAVIF